MSTTERKDTSPDAENLHPDGGDARAEHSGPDGGDARAVLREVSLRAARARRARLIGGICLLFLLLGGGWAGYWVLFLRDIESTDDAYTAGNLVRVSPRVSGTVKDIYVDNTQMVREGQVLARLDDADARLALERARSSLADAVRQTQGMMRESERLAAVISLRRTELTRAEGDYDRRRDRKTALSVSAEELSHARDNVAQAAAALRIAEHALQANRALLLNTPLPEQPLVRLRAHQLREAWLNLQRCEIKSPASGQVAKRAVQVGAHANPGDPLMAVVPLDGVWVDANFKEVQIGRMRIGQKARVRADMYGSSVTYSGTVVGFSAGTGSSFSLLPPENATGNWIKVVQRIPVKIALDPGQLGNSPLLVGLSCSVSVDVRDAGGSMLATSPGQGPETPVFSTEALDQNLESINQEIESIIASHSDSHQP